MPKRCLDNSLSLILNRCRKQISFLSGPFDLQNSSGVKMFYDVMTLVLFLL